MSKVFVMRISTTAEILQRQNEAISNLKEVKDSPITRNLPSSSPGLRWGHHLNFQKCVIV